MDFKIYANETTTVLEALADYRKRLELDISTVKNSKDTWAIDDIVKRIECKRETLNRVICRIEEL